MVWCNGHYYSQTDVDTGEVVQVDGIVQGTVACSQISQTHNVSISLSDIYDGRKWYRIVPFVRDDAFGVLIGKSDYDFERYYYFNPWKGGMP